MTDRSSPPMYCSTSLCPWPGEPIDLVTRWEELCAHLGLAGLVLDQRLGPDAQREALRLALERGLSCLQVVHPRVSGMGRPAASPCSPDRDEQRAAREQLERSARRAHDLGVPQLLLMPSTLALTPGRAALGARFSRGEPLRLEQLEPEREARANRAMDALCLVLDRTLRQLERLDTTLVLPWPAPWPDLFPVTAEVEQLGRVFAGAPLDTAFATDWWHVARTLGTAPGRFPAAGSWRVADACGIATALPPGSGELCWDELPGEERGAAWVLTVSADLRVERAELQRGVELLNGAGGPGLTAG